MMLFVCFCVVLCVSFCTGHFVMVLLNLTYLHCLQHSLFEHLFNLYFTVFTSICEVNGIFVIQVQTTTKQFDCELQANYIPCALFNNNIY